MRGKYSGLFFQIRAWTASLIIWAGFFLPPPLLSADIDENYAGILRKSRALDSQLAAVIEDLDNPGRLSAYPRRLLSIERNAELTLGGELRVNYSAVSGGYAGANPSGDVRPPVGPAAGVKAADLKVSAALLSLAARLGPRWRAYMEMDLQGLGGRPDHIAATRNVSVLPDYSYIRREKYEPLGQAYVELRKAGPSGFGFRLGLMDLPFGLTVERRERFGRSFLDAEDLTGSRLLEPANRLDGLRLPHASRLSEPAAALLLNYEMRDIVRFEAGLFQENRESRGGERGLRSGPLAGLGSWQVGASLLPLEGWELSAFFRNRRSASRGLRRWVDSPFRSDFRGNLVSGNLDPRWDDVNEQWSDSGTGPSFGSRRNEQALSIGLALEIPNTALAIRLEYAHGWNQGFNKYISSDGANLGLSYKVGPFLALFGQAEWLTVRDGSWVDETGSGRDSRNNRLARFLLGAEYELSRSLTLEAGWQYEYWRLLSERGGAGSTRERLANRANLFYLGSRFVF